MTVLFHAKLIAYFFFKYWTGLQHYVIRGDTADGLPLSQKLLPEYLKDLGYSTHLVGKWHLGHATKLFSPTFRGFDTHFGCWLASQDYYDHTSTDAVKFALIDK